MAAEQSSSDPNDWPQAAVVDYLLAVVDGKHEQLCTLVAANDKRYEERFSASQKALELGLSGTRGEISVALAAAKEAVLKAENATEKRFESVNEFRGTLDNQQRTLIPRSEVAEIRQGLEEKIHNLTKLLDEVRTQTTSRTAERRGVQGGWGYAVGAVGLVLGVLGIVAAFTAR